MKRFSVFALLLLGAIFTLSAQEDYKDAELYFLPEQMPDMKQFLPGPPAEDSQAFKYDLAVYELGKTIRATDKEAAKAAQAQSDNRLGNLCKQFSEAFGMEISQEKTPQIYLLLRDGIITCVKSIIGPKEYYHRTRPFAYHKEGTLMPDREGMLHQNGSFPSGHTLRGWATALLLLEVNPDRAEELLALGYQYGQSRVISGYHWQSDVDASRLVAAAAVAKLHTSDRFQKQMKRAKREFNRLTK
ncbi:MAG: phosphatase PAP2 family protein [Alistipes sp.]|nr:phosphatase PAP2 family protein [Alistipes sp.]